ncbi:MAG: hypothetical protein OEM15_03970 [Myxococcales bacterium]|nr:hypothetical protein [Myxococcales bacterium]MDH3483868.1 hypothetical protein [Myxococcales bacterium]
MAVDAQSLVRRAARGTTWAQFVDYMSPALYEVMPLRSIFVQGKEFISNGLDSARFAQARQQVEAWLQDQGGGIQLGAGSKRDGEQCLSDLREDARRAIGQQILELYFGQIFTSDHAILDLRAESFAAAEEGILWRPRSIYLEWQPEFLRGLRDLYAGFYLDDDPRFERGLDGLNLEEAGDLLVSHLGNGDQRSVRFEMSVFQSSFHQMFLRCRDRGISLHRNFVALGTYLVCLYHVLETLDLELDVRAAFERIHA